MVKDKTNLQTIFTSNEGYKVIKIPMLKKEDGWHLKLDARTFVEDIPFGIVVLKDIAEKLNLETPTLDMCIEWH
jgi:opine dehydrogenase